MNRRFWQGMVAGTLLVFALATWLRPRLRPTAREQLAQAGQGLRSSARRFWRSSREKVGELKERVR